MKKDFKSIFLKIGSYILITYFIYYLVLQYFIFQFCSPIIGGLGSAYMCFGIYNFFYKSSIYFYLLFLSITIGLYFKKTHKSYNPYFFVIGNIVLIVIIIFIYLNTPVTELSQFKINR